MHEERTVKRCSVISVSSATYALPVVLWNVSFFFFKWVTASVANYTNWNVSLQNNIFLGLPNYSISSQNRISESLASQRVVLIEIELEQKVSRYVLVHTNNVPLLIQ